MSSHHVSQRWQKAEMFYHAAAIPYLHVLSFKEITQPVSRAEEASQSPIIPTVNTHLWTHHLAHTPKSVAISCTPHHAHLKHTRNTNKFTFSATPPTTEWKWIVKHRVEKMHGVIHSPGLQVITEKLASVKGRKKERVALRKVYSLSSVGCKGCQESTVS